ncbi:TEA/ATTS domain family-domain-containing protein [Boletus edulis]|nr:TEA/ATTS domain family-domain-containing protein [Boletus edulis]
MESTEVNIKPTIPADDNPVKSSHTAPGVNKLKQSRYEDVWPEDVHAAFMEAVALYPPMGKRRLKYYRVSTHENEHFSDANRAKSFGRCQLIQSYILDKTGKNRSRKQVSSHLQRLKKIHKDNPAMHHLFSERPQPPEHSSAPQSTARSSQDIFTNISVSTRHIKSDPDLPVNLQDMDTGAISSSALTYPSETSSFDGGSCNALSLSTNFQHQPSLYPPQEFLPPLPRQCPAGALHPSNSDYISELQDALLFKDTINEGFRSGSAFNTSAFSISMCRLASKLPIQGRLVDSSPTTQMHFSHAVRSPGFHPTHQWISQDNLMDGVSYQCNSPLTPVQEAFYTPLFPLQLDPSETQRFDNGLASEWTWPKNPNVPLDPQREGSFDEIRLRYLPAMYQYDPSCLDTRVNISGSHSSPSESEASQLPRGLYYSYAVTSPATASESVSNEGTVDFQSPESFENLASPLVIRPTPVYPISYTHSNIHSDSECRTSVPNLPPY